MIDEVQVDKNGNATVIYFNPTMGYRTRKFKSGEWPKTVKGFVESCERGDGIILEGDTTIYAREDC